MVRCCDSVPHDELTGERGPTILLLPTWTVLHKRFWKAQAPYLSLHFRVVCYDGPRQQPLRPAAGPGVYNHDVRVRHALPAAFTLQAYTHVIPGMDQAAADTVAALILGSAAQLAPPQGRILGRMILEQGPERDDDPGISPGHRW